jgi:hypothetical protein
MSSSRSAARAAACFGALSVLAIPAGVVAARFLNGVGLVRSLYVSVPVTAVLALPALVAARRARLAASRTVFQERRGPVRTARLLAWAGLYLAVTGGLALGVYAVLRARQ